MRRKILLCMFVFLPGALAFGQATISVVIPEEDEEISPNIVIDTSGNSSGGDPYINLDYVKVKISGPAGRTVNADSYTGPWEATVRHQPAPSTANWPDGSYTCYARLFDGQTDVMKAESVESPFTVKTKMGP